MPAANPYPNPTPTPNQMMNVGPEKGAFVDEVIRQVKPFASTSISTPLVIRQVPTLTLTLTTDPDPSPNPDPNPTLTLTLTPP